MLDGPVISLAEEGNRSLVDFPGYIDGWDEESAAS